MELLAAGSGTLTRYAQAQLDADSKSRQSQAEYALAARQLRHNQLDLRAVADATRARLAAFEATGSLQQAASIAAAELNTAAGVVGDNVIRDNIRWDEDKEAFWVTLHKNGKPHEVLVENVYDHGATQIGPGWWTFNSEKPSIAALYETAIAQESGYGYIANGGFEWEAMEIITGQEVERIQDPNKSGLDGDQFQDLGRVIDDGWQVVMASRISGVHPVASSALVLRLRTACSGGPHRQISPADAFSPASRAGPPAPMRAELLL